MSLELQIENEALKKQIAQNSQGVQNLIAQLEAHKQHLNDTITGCLNLRTHLITAQKANQDLAAQVEGLKKKVAELENPVCQ